MLKQKREATWYIKVLLPRLETQLPELKIKRLHSDQGGEFMSNELAVYYDKHGIVQQYTNAYYFQENGIVETAIGIVLPRVWAMLTATHMPNTLWGEALQHVVTALNWLSTKPLGFVSPHHSLFRSAPDIDDLRT